MELTDISFSDSNKYLQDTSILQSEVWFVSQLNIDIYVKKTFKYSQDGITVSGWYIKSFNSSHRISDSFVCYKIQLINNQPFVSTQWAVTFDLKKEWFFSWTMIKNIIQGLPIVSLLIISIITLILPPFLANIFRYINIIGMVILLFFYGRKFIKIFYNLLKNKWIDYNGVTVRYKNKADTLTITPEYIEILKKLHGMNIQKVVLWKGDLYCKQNFTEPNFWTTIANIFSHDQYSNIAIDKIVFSTIEFLFSTSFISQHHSFLSWEQNS